MSRNFDALPITSAEKKEKINAKPKRYWKRRHGLLLAFPPMHFILFPSFLCGLLQSENPRDEKVVNVKTKVPYWWLKNGWKCKKNKWRVSLTLLDGIFATKLSNLFSLECGVSRCVAMSQWIIESGTQDLRHEFFEAYIVDVISSNRLSFDWLAWWLTSLSLVHFCSDGTFLVADREKMNLPLFRRICRENDEDEVKLPLRIQRNKDASRAGFCLRWTH